MSDEWTEHGALVQIVVTRSRLPADPHHNCAIGVFLVDLGCLGIKNAFARITTRAERQELVARIQQTAQLSEVSPDLALKVICEATAYAADLGFDPHPDAAAALPLLHDADPSAAAEQIPLGGPEGKPLYIAGPHDDPDRILHQLEARLGRDAFHYMLRA